MVYNHLALYTETALTLCTLLNKDTNLSTPHMKTSCKKNIGLIGVSCQPEFILPTLAL